MGESKEEIKNPSLRERPSKRDPLESLKKQYYELQGRYFEVLRKAERERREWERHYKRLCLFFLIIGCIVGFIVGAILL